MIHEIYDAMWQNIPVSIHRVHYDDKYGSPIGTPNQTSPHPQTYRLIYYCPIGRPTYLPIDYSSINRTT